MATYVLDFLWSYEVNRIAIHIKSSEYLLSCEPPHEVHVA